MAKILIVDDDAEIVSLLTDFLKDLGHDVDHAGDPVEGMSKARSMAPDLIILDFHLPKTTGAHLFESLRRNQKSRLTPILFMSGEASPEEILSEISDNQGSRFMPKPIRLEEFKRTIQEMLADSSANAHG